MWCICGDGSFQMTLQELATIVEHELPIKFAIINNGYLGMVRQWQTLFYGNRLVSTREFSPDYREAGRGLRPGGPARHRARRRSTPTIEKALRHPGPVLIDFQVEGMEDCYPMVPPGASLAETIDQPKIEAPASSPRREKEKVRP